MCACEPPVTDSDTLDVIISRTGIETSKIKFTFLFIVSSYISLKLQKLWTLELPFRLTGSSLVTPPMSIGLLDEI